MENDALDLEVAALTEQIEKAYPDQIITTAMFKTNISTNWYVYRQEYIDRTKHIIGVGLTRVVALQNAVDRLPIQAVSVGTIGTAAEFDEVKENVEELFSNNDPAE